ncbi:MAG: tetratricopeptide repeat protein [Bacteroidetes bacterium]|nr:tetratricopeptide repeat protein [Bacteroidota bacterium]
MKFYNLLIKYRLPLGFLALILAIIVNFYSGFWPAFTLYFLALIAIVSHFLFGPMRLIQGYMEDGDIEGAQKILDSIRFPNLLIKPVRSVYYFLKSNLALVKQDFDTAETLMKKSLNLGMPMKETEGAAYFQLGSIAMQKSNMKQAEEYIRKAIRAGLPDKENTAAAYLQMCQIFINKREFRAAKDYFRRAKEQKPTTAQVVDQIKQIEKYISRIPG